MAIVQNPITGRTRKSFGTAVFSTQFGKNIMRTKPILVKNPKTAKQLAQRKKFSTVVSVLRPVKSILNEVYAGSLPDISPFSKILGINLTNAFTGTPPELDQHKLVLCTFDGSTVDNVVITAEPNQVMKIDWSPNTTNVEELAHAISFVIFNCTSNESAYFPNVALRSAGTANVIVPKTWVGALITIHIKTTDFTQILSDAPKQILKYKGGSDLANVVK